MYRAIIEIEGNKKSFELKVRTQIVLNNQVLTEQETTTKIYSEENRNHLKALLTHQIDEIIKTLGA